MNKTGWKREIVGMRQMTSQFANIPVDQITGGYSRHFFKFCHRIHFQNTGEGEANMGYRD
jgi:hypothetical protein